LPSPLVFRRWAAIAGISMSLERRCWIGAGASRIYPNLYILLVANPGVGKDMAIGPLRDLLHEAKKIHIAPASMTGKGLLDELGSCEATRTQVNTLTGQLEEYHAMGIIVPELGVLIPANDLGFFSIVNDAYNCGHELVERTRGGGKITITKPHLAILGGTQPKFLGNLLPEAAYGMGFPARLCMIYSDQAVKVSPFVHLRQLEPLRKALLSDLLRISELSGPFGISEEAQNAVEHWHLHESDLDKPKHGRLVHYSTRRIMHLLKLCMAISASESDAMIVEMRHFLWAKATLLEAEADMPNIFRAMTVGSHEQLFEDAMSWFAMASAGQPVSHQRLTTYWSSRVPSGSIAQMIETMVGAGMLRRTTKVQKDGSSLHTYLMGEWSKVE